MNSRWVLFLIVVRGKIFDLNSTSVLCILNKLVEAHIKHFLLAPRRPSDCKGLKWLFKNSFNMDCWGFIIFLEVIFLSWNLQDGADHFVKCDSFDFGFVASCSPKLGTFHLFGILCFPGTDRKYLVASKPRFLGTVSMCQVLIYNDISII